MVLVPHRLGRDRAIRGYEAGSATRKRKGAGRRKIDMRRSIPFIRSFIGRTVVAGRDANRDSQQSRSLQGLIKLGLKAIDRNFFRTAPTYGNDRRVVFGI